MNKHELIQKIKELQGIQPSLEWQKSSREILMSRLQKSLSGEGQMSALELSRKILASGAYFLKLYLPLKVVLKPLVVVILILSLAFGSGIATVSAALNSLPGDVFYPVKIISEMAQVTLATSEENKAILEMDFAGRRLAELNGLNQRPVSEGKKKEGVEQTVKKFQAKVETVKKRLEKIEKEENPAQAVRVAKFVEVKSDQYEEALAHTEKDLSTPIKKEVKKEISEAINSVEEANSQALRVMVAKTEKTQLPQEELHEILEKKIQKIEKKLQKIEKVISQPAVEEMLGEEAGEEILSEEKVADGAQDEIKNEQPPEDAPVPETVAESKKEEISLTKGAINKINEEKVGAKDILGEAKEYLSQKNLEVALEKMSESKKKVLAIEQEVDLVEEKLEEKAQIQGEAVQEVIEEQSTKELPPEPEVGKPVKPLEEKPDTGTEIEKEKNALEAAISNQSPPEEIQKEASGLKDEKSVSKKEENKEEVDKGSVENKESE